MSITSALSVFSAFFLFCLPVAQAADAAPPVGNTSFFVMTGALIFLMYFMIWRPQSRRARAQRDLVQSVQKGDEIVTAGGVLGTVTRVMDNHLQLALTGNVEILLQKTAVATVLPKGTLKSL